MTQTRTITHTPAFVPDATLAVVHEIADLGRAAARHAFMAGAGRDDQTRSEQRYECEDRIRDLTAHLSYGAPVVPYMHG